MDFYECCQQHKPDITIGFYFTGVTKMSHVIRSYQLVSAIDPDSFSRRIQALLEEGYVFHGTVVMSVDSQSKRHYAQAMVLVDKKSPLCGDVEG